ncbi:hypothetical protein [Xanthomonas phaseoli]|uniref:hypothetical protein n=1 Tax=Xanthomonas phaseoli TaxID=1985254 RepID=UPI003CCF517C
MENSTFLRNRLLNKLVEHGLIDKDVSTNRLYLPADGKLADEVETSPHRGRTRVIPPLLAVARSGAKRPSPTSWQA